MSKFPTVFITIITASCAVFGCAQPIGTIKGGVAGGKLDDFWTVPQRQYYVHGDDFVRRSDFRAFASSRGLVESVPIERVTITLIKDPKADRDAPDNKFDIKSDAYNLPMSLGTGQKLIVVTYDNKTSEYSIEIRNVDGTRDPEDNNGSSVEIQWK